MDTTLTALTTFAFAASATPGPNNLMLMTSGAKFGLRRTAPHWLGVSLGFAAMVLALGAGLSRLFATTPALGIGLKIAGVAYMLWLAWRIAGAGRSEAWAASERPWTFLQAAAFQWANPKAWAMALTAIALYASSGGMRDVAVASVVAAAVNLPCVGLWAVAGRQLRAFAEEPRRRKIINRALAALLVLSTAAMLVGH